MGPLILRFQQSSRVYNGPATLSNNLGEPGGAISAYQSEIYTKE